MEIHRSSRSTPSSRIGAGYCRGRSQSRWSARSAARTYDLDCDLCAALECPAREDRTGHWWRRSPWFVTAGGRAGAGAGMTAWRQRPAPVRGRARGSGPGCRQLWRDSLSRPSTARHSATRSAHPRALAAPTARVRPEPDGMARRRRALESSS